MQLCFSRVAPKVFCEHKNPYLYSFYIVSPTLARAEDLKRVGGPSYVAQTAALDQMRSELLQTIRMFLVQNAFWLYSHLDSVWTTWKTQDAG